MKTTKGTFGIGVAFLAMAIAACGGGAPAPAPAATAAPAAAPASSIVSVEMTWDGPKDMDLEIWDSSGKHFLARSFNLCGEDRTSGGAPETFEFKKYDTGHFPEEWDGSRELDYSHGTYVVSAYFHGNSVSHDATIVVLKVKKADGTVDERRRKIEYDPGKDQWHAFTIDAATGAIADIDEFFKPQ